MLSTFYTDLIDEPKIDPLNMMYSIKPFLDELLDILDSSIVADKKPEFVREAKLFSKWRYALYRRQYLRVTQDASGRQHQRHRGLPRRRDQGTLETARVCVEQQSRQLRRFDELDEFAVPEAQGVCRKVFEEEAFSPRT